MLISRDYMCSHNGTVYQVTLPAEVWSEWEARAITQVIEKKAFRIKSKNGYQLTDPYEPSLPPAIYMTRNWITSLFPDPAEYQGYFWQHGLDEYTIIKWLYAIIFESPTTRQGIKDQIVLYRMQLKNRIRVHIDEEYGVPVQFASNDKSPGILYYTYGSELYMIKDILHPEDTTVRCGVFVS